MLVACRTAQTAFDQTKAPEPLQLSLPILSAGEAVELAVNNIPLWRVNFSWLGLVAVIMGGAVVVLSWRQTSKGYMLIRGAGVLLVALGVLLQGDSAPWFFLLLAVSILLVLFIRAAKDSYRDLQRLMQHKNDQPKDENPVRQDVVSPEAGAQAGPVV